jgi:hypothetical protein
MNVSDITTRVADLIRNPDSAMPSDWERSIKKKQTQAPTLPEISKPSTPKIESNPVPSGEYSLVLSPLAQKILEDADSHESEWEKNRSESVQRIQQLVQEKQYSLHPEIVDEIARKIVAILP